MPLSKARNRQRMRFNRLHALLSPPQDSKLVQLKPVISYPGMEWIQNGEYRRINAINQVIDADGNVIPNY